MNKLDSDYINLIQDILDNGYVKSDRTGTGTQAVFGRLIRHKMSDGFPLLTTKKLHFASIAKELLWFLSGSTNIQPLVKQNVNIWTGDAYKRYKTTLDLQNNDLMDIEEFTQTIIEDDDFAARWGELGPVYGKQWRSWDNTVCNSGIKSSIDQIQTIIHQLKTNPDSRRIIVSAWNVADIDKAVLPPCHYGFQFFTRELSLEERLDLASKTYKVFDPSDFGIPSKVDHDEIDKLYPVARRAISLEWEQRSVDTGLGLPFNIASYGLLLLMVANEVNMVPDELIGSLKDTHLYLNHIDKLVNEQLPREGLPLPTVKLNKPVGHSVLDYEYSDFDLQNYVSYPAIKLPLSN